jgi:hypothetical protein
MKLISADKTFRTGEIVISELGVSVNLPQDTYYKQEFWPNVLCRNRICLQGIWMFLA